MAFIYREWRIIGASALAITLIGGAYLAAVGASHPRVAEASTETALLQAIASKDSDGDGLPDWEESLYGTDPQNPDSRHLGMSDGEAVAKGLIVPKAQVPAASTVPQAPTSATQDGIAPAATDSLTDLFAKNFFTLYVAAKQQSGAALTSNQIDALAATALQELTASVGPAPDFKTPADIKTAGTGSDALRAYAAAAEQVFLAQGGGFSTDELDSLTAAAQDTDPNAIANLARIASAYHDIAVGLLALTAPREIAPAHLALIDALARTGSIVGDFARLRTDPVATMLALQQYPQSLADLIGAFASITHVYSSAHITLSPGTPGSQFVGLSAQLQSAQATP